ncbi:hypothetical protein H696_05996 [Fonticula alba]|uniref:Uncharacterized protein n=1 Tax=Fonticula alba TaxID=691883 RepID=A0A058Z1W9_FONAL|nr:hypothetical protein H696_05996 [Fonticula alba]KCV67477.1 hypothetical protein H696_05996 [Fonticula alba]|eukprot:XP_009498038.1 hypothetical protein H696_05996 [Fonticula alba]
MPRVPCAIPEAVGASDPGQQVACRPRHTGLRVDPSPGPWLYRVDRTAAGPLSRARLPSAWGARGPARSAAAPRRSPPSASCLSAGHRAVASARPESPTGASFRASASAAAAPPRPEGPGIPPPPKAAAARTPACARRAGRLPTRNVRHNAPPPGSGQADECGCPAACSCDRRRRCPCARSPGWPAPPRSGRGFQQEDTAGARMCAPIGPPRPRPVRCPAHAVSCRMRPQPIVPGPR